MYKNKVLGLLSWAWLCPSLGEEAKEASASLSGNPSPLALSLTPAAGGPFLPSGDTTEETVEQITLRLSLCFYSFPSFLGNPLAEFSQSPAAPSTQHPVPSTQHCTVLAACLAGWPRLQVPFLPPNPQGTM